jgi:thiol-disulfide isomerase/thioredoxin
MLAFALLVGLISPAAAQDNKLKVGDKAPPVKATKWLQGKEIASFAEGKTYVMEFWATWCGPCIVMMPHMGELQTQYKDKGVTFIGFSAKDPNNSLEKVQAMVEKKGPKLGYTFAFAEDRDTYEAWMTASGQRGIPCCFVVDKAGKIAYIGHPMFLDVVLPKVVAGKWTEADLEGLKTVEKDVDAVFKAFGGDAEAGLKALADFDKKYPELAGIPYFYGPRVGLLLKAKKLDEAKKVAEGLITKGDKIGDDRMLMTLARTLVSPDAGGDKDLAALATKAADAGLKLAGDKDPVALYFAAEAYFGAGNKAKAKELGAKAIAAADNDNLKKQLEMLTKKYDEEKKEDKK